MSSADPPAFTPVPRQARRGFTADAQRRFIAALAATGSVATAAREIGMSRQAAYLLRAAPGADEFAAAWDAAITRGIAALKAVAFDRAIHGEPATVFHGGVAIGETRQFNNQLLMRLLTHYDPQDKKTAADTIRPEVAARLAAQAKPMARRNAEEARLARQWYSVHAWNQARTNRALATAIRQWLAEGPQSLEAQLHRLESSAADNPMLAADAADPSRAARFAALEDQLHPFADRLMAETVEAYEAAGLLPNVDLDW